MFTITNFLLNRKKSKPLSTHLDPQVVADEVADYFVDKIKKIWEAFPYSVREYTNVMMDVPTTIMMDVPTNVMLDVPTNVRMSQPTS